MQITPTSVRCSSLISELADDESDAKRAATGQGVTASAMLAPPAAPGYPAQPGPSSGYPPQYGAPA